MARVPYTYPAQAHLETATSSTGHIGAQPTKAQLVAEMKTQAKNYPQGRENLLLLKNLYPNLADTYKEITGKPRLGQRRVAELFRVDFIKNGWYLNLAPDDWFGDDVPSNFLVEELSEGKERGAKEISDAEYQGMQALGEWSNLDNLVRAETRAQREDEASAFAVVGSSQTTESSQTTGGSQTDYEYQAVYERSTFFCKWSQRANFVY